VLQQSVKASRRPFSKSGCTSEVLDQTLYSLER
jgi:hypothetical protein